MNAKSLIFLCTLVLSGFSYSEDAAVARGEALSNTCVACHGAAGNSINPEWPSLAGQHQDYLQAQIVAFRDGKRAGALMTGLFDNYSEQDINDIAAYFSAQSAVSGLAQTDLVAHGETIFRAGLSDKGVSACAACHGPTGAGMYGYAPSVRGQKINYSIKQLQNYASGERNNGANALMMQSIAKRLSDEDMQAVASFMQGLTEREWSQSVPASPEKYVPDHYDDEHGDSKEH